MKRKTILSQQLEMELTALYPGVNIKKKLRDYDKEKIIVGLKIGTAGLVVVLVAIGNLMMNGDLEDARYLEREAMGGGKKEITLDAMIGDEVVHNVEIVVAEQELSKEKIHKAIREIKEGLIEVILGENESQEHVEHPLNLVTGWKDTEIAISWSSSDDDVLQEDGSFGEGKIPENGKDVTLTARIAYGEIQTEKEIKVKVFPKEKTRQEMLQENLLKAVNEKDRESINEGYLELPDMLQGEPVVWKEQKKDTVIFLLMFPFIVAFAVLWGKDQEIHKQYKERNRQLLLEYSEFVSKLQLLIGCGMSTRNAFGRLAADYQNRIKKGGRKRFVYEEVGIMVRKLENGMSETEAYTYFSKRCNLLCYKKLVALIIQNQKKGTDGLKDCLMVETKNAFEERKLEARRLGEEAGTKLLLPMMMMMVIVLMIIVIPAYCSFGGI